VPDINIAESIVEHRRQLEMTQGELANYLGVSKAAVSKWEVGLSNPAIEQLPRLAALFGVSIDELMRYDPQLSSRRIRQMRQDFASAFSSRPFDSVIDEVHEAIQRYYSCYPFLVEMATLLVNHANLAQDAEPDHDGTPPTAPSDPSTAPELVEPDQVGPTLNRAQSALLEEAVGLCRRTKMKTDDLALARRANSIEAFADLMLGHPAEAVDLLSAEMAQFDTSDELILARAQQAMGDVEAARRTLQVTTYQYLPRLLDACAGMLGLYRDDPAHFEATLERGLAVAEAYDVARLYPNALIQVTFAAAMCLAEQGQAQRALGFLEQSVAAFDNFEFPLLLHGDAYFDLVDEWLCDSEIGVDAPRDAALVKQSFLAALTNPVLATLAEHPRYKKLVDHVRASR
jgi:transcriptional regulator with XRE-family HTH domain